MSEREKGRRDRQTRDIRKKEIRKKREIKAVPRRCVSGDNLGIHPALRVLAPVTTSATPHTHSYS